MASWLTRSTDTGRSMLDSGTRVAVTTMAESSAPLSPQAPAQDPRPNQAPASAAAKRADMINGFPGRCTGAILRPRFADKRNRKQSQQSLEIFIKVSGWLAVNSDLNKHSKTQVLHA